MSTSTGRRAAQRSAPGHAAPRRDRTVPRRAAVAAGAGLAVAALVALPQPGPAPAPTAAANSAASPAGLLALDGAARSPAALLPSATLLPSAAGETLAPTTAAPGGPGVPGVPGVPGASSVQPAAYVVPSSTLTPSGIPAAALAAYRHAAATAPRGCGIDWSLLAAIGRVESNHGRFGGATLGADGRSTPRVLGPVLDGTSTALIPDTDGGRLDGSTTYDRAVGPMQFIPSTWSRYAVDADGDGVSDPFDIDDAAAAAARYLCAAGGDLTATAGQARAVLAYNHSDSYVATVLTLAAAYAGGRVPTLPAPQPLPAIEPVNPAPPAALGGVPPTVPSGPPATPPSSTPPPGGPVVLADGAAPLAPASQGSTTPDTATPGTTTPGTTTPDTTTPGTTTSGATTPGATTPGTTPGTTTPGTTTSGTTTPGATTPGTTTPVTTTPGTTTPGTTTPGTTTPGTTTPGTTTPGTTSTGTPPPTGCPTLPRVVVDVVNETGDPAVAEDVTARLQSAGMTIGSVTSGTGATASSISYPAAAKRAAARFAAALGLTADLQQAAVDHVTVVLAGSGAGEVQAAVDRISCPA